MTEQSTRRTGRWQLYAIVAVAVLSIGGSYSLFYVSKSTGGWGTTNNGAFVSPPMTTDDLGWRDVSGSQVRAERWWVWHVTAGCSADCLAANRELLSLHTLLNKEARRVRLGFTDLTGADKPDDVQADEIRVPGVAVQTY